MIEIFLHQGEYYVGDARCRIRTLLGSCVSITVWHRERRIGAMSHFLLASRSRAATDGLDARYGDEALQLMVRDLAEQNVSAVACEAKLFGGGNMFPAQTRVKAKNVGHRNGIAAHALLQAYGIRIVSESLFGIGYRQIIFDVSTGHVWSRQVKPKLSPSETRKT